MATEDLIEIGNMLYERRGDGVLYPVRRVRPDTEARGAPAQDPSLLNVGGIGERLAFLNQTFNPIEGIGGSMRAASRMAAPDQSYWDRIAALGEMASGVASIAAPVAAARAIGVPAASAMMEGLLGGSPTTQAAGDMARQFVADESGAFRLPMPQPVRAPDTGAGSGRPPLTFDEVQRAMQEAQGIRAYQGSPHNFAAERLVRMPDGSTQYIVGQPDVLPDVPAGAEVLQDFPIGRMRMDKLGTGEGAQAYGHGLYVAEAEPVALEYRQRLARVGTAEAEKIGIPPSQLNTFQMFARQTDPSQPEAAARDFANWTGIPYTPELVQAYKNTFKNSGKVYEVNINADPEDFINFDAPFEQQPPNVQNYFGYLARGERKPTGEDLARRMESNIYIQEAAQAGIPGIRYLDEGSRNQAVQPYYNIIRESDNAVVQQKIARDEAPSVGEGFRAEGPIDPRTRNYVVFDDNLISIVRKYGIAGAAAMLGVSAADVEEAIAQGMPPSQWDQLVTGPQ
jgi:hypothetical protein